MCLVMENIKDLDKHGEEWREDFNGIGYQVHCDDCGKHEEDAKDMFRFLATNGRFFDGSYMYCDECAAEYKKAMLELVSNDLREGVA